jgi:LuxR family maltose regulon positive regulatory protein
VTVGAAGAADTGGSTARRARPSWLVDRHELVAELERATQEADVTLVVAAAGSGKSTLLSQWCAAREEPVWWVRLRATDTDPLLCGQRIVTAVRDGTEEVLDKGPPDLTDARFRRRLAEALVVGARGRPGAVLVIEDLHRADATSALHLGEVVDEASGALPVVVASRVDPHWPLSEWRLEGRLRELRQHDLDLDARAGRRGWCSAVCRPVPTPTRVRS